MSNKKTKGIMLLLVVAVVLMTVGFAAYAQRLNITGNVTVKGKPWNVHYDTDTLSEAGVTATSSSLGTTDFSFTVTLEKPGDYYQATFDVVNEGSITAYLRSLTMSSISGHSNYLSYTVSYNGTTYNGTNGNITGVTLAASGSHTVIVRVEYLEPADQANLPTSDVNVTVTGNLDYSSEAGA